MSNLYQFADSTECVFRNVQDNDIYSFGKFSDSTGRYNNHDHDATP